MSRLNAKNCPAKNAKNCPAKTRGSQKLFYLTAIVFAFT